MSAGYTAVHLAAQFGHTSIVAYLIAKGQDIDARDMNGMTPLMWSCFRVFGYSNLLLYILLNSPDYSAATAVVLTI